MTTTSRPASAPARADLSRAAIGAIVAFGAVVVVHLVAQLTGPEGLRVWTQVAAMPLLAAVVLTATRGPRGHVVTWLVAGIGLSWLGDSAPKLAGEHSFLVMVGFFLLAQVAYVIAFWTERDRSVLARGTRAWPVPLLGYLALLGLLLVWCVPGAGSLLVPVVLYGVVLVAMAVLATGIHPLAAVGGFLFVVSDGLIALSAFTDWYSLDGHGLAVMSTYLVAQSLLVAGVLALKRVAAHD